MDKNEDLCGSLIKWLQTFELEAPHRTAEDICDGVAMAQALAQIDPEIFNEKFLSKIKVDAGSKWRVKVSNLRKIVEGVADFYREYLNVTDFTRPDLIQIGEKCNREELGRLLQLILGCAVKCSHKEDYVVIIMGMEENVQHLIKQAIEELPKGGRQISPGVSGDDGRLQQMAAELQKIIEERDQMCQKCHELDMQVSLLQEEKQSILQDKERLHARLEEMEKSHESLGGGSKYYLLKKKYDELQEENVKLETIKDDMKLQIESQERDIFELESKVDEHKGYAEEVRQLKDEVDVMRETIVQLEQYKTMVESYKNKLEELSGLKRHLKMLEGRNSEYMQQNLELEEEVKKLGTLRAQVDLYKKQVAELYQKFGEETRRADKLEFEGKKSMAQIQFLTREKVELIAERDTLKETVLELTCSKTDPRTPTDIGLPGMIPSDLSEKLARLTQENEKLRLKQQEAEQLPVIQARLDNSDFQVQTLTGENRIANQRILELESQISEIQGSGNADNITIRKEMVSLQSQLTALKTENETQKKKIENQEELLEESNRKCAQLKDSLTRKETELQSKDEKMQKCVQKAHDVLNSFEMKHGLELKELKKELSEKNNRLQQMEKDMEDKRNCFDTEMKLVTSHFYDAGIRRQRESVDRRLAALSNGQSFLARQRQPTNRRLPTK